MFKVFILACSITNPNPYGCGPNTALDKTEVGNVTTEAACFMLGREQLNLTKFKDTNSKFHKVVCVK